mmetsp:Transcript_22806/g.63330  ORF Transcript_22806/g.63330 Transcript_22806/m.63330 type:complete len:257 (+) Transcript_22806:376-1146(+)
MSYLRTTVPRGTPRLTRRRRSQHRRRIHLLRVTSRGTLWPQIPGQHRCQPPSSSCPQTEESTAGRRAAAPTGLLPSYRGRRMKPCRRVPRTIWWTRNVQQKTAGTRTISPVTPWEKKGPHSCHRKKSRLPPLLLWRLSEPATEQRPRGQQPLEQRRSTLGARSVATEQHALLRGLLAVLPWEDNCHQTDRSTCHRKTRRRGSSTPPPRWRAATGHISIAHSTLNARSCCSTTRGCLLTWKPSTLSAPTARWFLMAP